MLRIGGEGEGRAIKRKKRGRQGRKEVIRRGKEKQNPNTEGQDYLPPSASELEMMKEINRWMDR